MRYAIEIHLIEIDEAGAPVKTISTWTTDTVSDRQDSMVATADYLHDRLCDAVVEPWDGENLTSRETGEPAFEEESESE